MGRGKARHLSDWLAEWDGQLLVEPRGPILDGLLLYRVETPRWMWDCLGGREWEVVTDLAGKIVSSRLVGMS